MSHQPISDVAGDFLRVVLPRTIVIQRGAPFSVPEVYVVLLEGAPTFVDTVHATRCPPPLNLPLHLASTGARRGAAP